MEWLMYEHRSLPESRKEYCSTGTSGGFISHVGDLGCVLHGLQPYWPGGRGGGGVRLLPTTIYFIDYRLYAFSVFSLVRVTWRTRAEIIQNPEA
jgi:hypothetical protein